MKSDNPDWGAQRIRGELLQLGFDVSEPTVSRYLRRLELHADLEKAKRWLAFVENNYKVVAAFDFFVVPTLTFRVLYGFVVIEHHPRRILHFNATAHPPRASGLCRNCGRRCRCLVHTATSCSIAPASSAPTFIRF